MYADLEAKRFSPRANITMKQVISPRRRQARWGPTCVSCLGCRPFQLLPR